MIQFLFILFISLLASTGFSQESKANSLYEGIFGLNVTSFDYKEELVAPLKSTEKGTFFIPYVQGKVFFPRLQKSYFNGEFEFSGRVESDFDGSTQLGTPIQGKNNHVLFRLEADFYWNLTENFFVYSGYGYRYWDRFLSGGTGYREIYTWGYIPLGALIEFPLSEQVQIGVDFAYLIMRNGKLKVIFSETVINGDDTELTLGNKPGYRLRLPIDFLQASKGPYSFQVTPWYELSEIGESDEKYNSTMAGQIKEPASKTIQYGLILGLKVRF